MAQMYAGDEVGAVMLDVGSVNARAGFAGNDVPSVVVASAAGVLYTVGKEGAVGAAERAPGEAADMEVDVKPKPKYYVGTNSLSYRRDNMDVKYPFENGLVSDWDVTEAVWEHCLRERLGYDTTQHPLLLSEPSFNTKPIREQMTELAFEKFGVPAAFICKSAVLTAFSYGKTSGLVVDSGGGVTSCTPVNDGYALQKAIVRCNLAGEMLTDEYLKILESRSVVVNPTYLVKDKREVDGRIESSLRDLPGTTSGYHQFCVKNVVRDLKESVCRTFDYAFDEEANAHMPTIQYELPDGKVFEAGTDRFKVPEFMFYPDQMKRPAEEELQSIQQMVFNSVAKCEPDLRRELFGGILLTGGNTLFQGFTERFHKELLEKSPPQMYKVKIFATNTPIERKFSSWIGGSILGSLGTFQQMWMSKQEYEEYGRTMVDRKCP